MVKINLPARFSKPLWHLVDARGQTVGRLATQLATILRGKHKPNYDPARDCGDYIVVVNAAEVHLSGKKKKQKKYYWHTGWVGGLKTRTVDSMLDHKPEEVLRRAVLGMLPKNNLRKKQATKLRIFPGQLHFHEDKLPPGTESILKESGEDIRFRTEEDRKKYEDVVEKVLAEVRQEQASKEEK